MCVGWIKITLKHHFLSEIENHYKSFTTHPVNEAVGEIDVLTHTGDNLTWLS